MPWLNKLPHPAIVVKSMVSYVTLTGSDTGGLREITTKDYHSGFYDGVRSDALAQQAPPPGHRGEEHGQLRDPDRQRHRGAARDHHQGLPLGLLRRRPIGCPGSTSSPPRPSW